MSEIQTDSNGKPLRGIIAHIHRSWMGDCSKQGISSRADRVIVVGPGVPEVFTATEKEPAVEIGTVTFDGETTYHLRPYGEPGKQYMAGGTFVFTSDSRFRELFPFYGAVPLHDRHEG